MNELTEIAEATKHCRICGIPTRRDLNDEPICHDCIKWSILYHQIAISIRRLKQTVAKATRAFNRIQDHYTRRQAEIFIDLEEI